MNIMALWRYGVMAIFLVAFFANCAEKVSDKRNTATDWFFLKSFNKDSTFCR